MFDYNRAGVPVTVNTDNIGTSAASLADNLALLAAFRPGITRLELLQLQRNAVRATFVSPVARSRLLTATSATIPKP